MTALSFGANAVTTPSPPVSAAATGERAVQAGQGAVAPAATKYIREYRVQGAHLLPRVEVEEAVYPFLGPGRTADDVEQARAALEKAYQARGYQACSVQVPPQEVRGGIVYLQVSEGKVGRLRVVGARYFLPDQIKAKARSLAEGRVVNFNDVTRDIVALNQLPDRQITPALRPGEVPGTVDIDLNVKDTFPLHGSVELNNRYSADTVPLRLNGSVSYNNLWQAGHSVGVSFQVAPERPKDSEVFSAYYTARIPNLDWLSFSVQGTKQDSDVNTLGSLDVAGKGEVIGARAIVTLPPGKDFYHSLSFGFDYKHFTQLTSAARNPAVTAAANAGLITLTPITYYPLSLNYSATWVGKKTTLTEFNTGVTLSFRGSGSDSAEFDFNRFKADANFIYLRGDLSRTQELPKGWQAYAKVQGQVSDQPLVSSEQFAGGGLGTVRGYLESEVLGDNAICGTVELRTPSLLSWLHGKDNEWRIYVFGDAGRLSIRSPLPDQISHFELASYGIGSRMRLFDHLNGSIDAAVPLIGQTTTNAHDLFLTFRVWADF